MAITDLTPSLTIDTDNTTHEQYKITENTGVYNASTNTGGYGSPNPEDSDVCQFIIGFKRGVSVDDKNLSAYISNTDSEDGDPAKSWTIDISSDGANTKDGWYAFYVVNADIYDAGTTYAANQIVSYSNALWKSLVGSNVGNTVEEGVNWTAVDTSTDSQANVDALDAILGSPTTYVIAVGELEDVMVENAEVYYANQVAAACSECDGCSDLADEVKTIEYLEFYMRCAYANETKENYTAAEKNIEILKDIESGKCATCI